MPIPMMAVGLGAQFLGGLLGGKKRKKAAQAVTHRVEAITDLGIAAYEDAQRYVTADRADQAALIASDEARLKAATGYDLVKLRGDAKRAGFNPLTVLQATGAAGYDGRGAVLTTPFIGRTDVALRRADAFMDKAGLVSGTGQAQVDTAGYFGDALSGLGKGIFDMGEMDAQRRHEAALQTQQINAYALGAVGGTRVAASRGGATPFVGARSITASPVSTDAFIGPPDRLAKVRMYDPVGGVFEVSKSWADRNGFNEWDQFSPGDYEQWLGESGQAASLGYSVPEYPGIASGAAGGVSWNLGTPSPGARQAGGRSGGLRPQMPPPAAVEWHWPSWSGARPPVRFSPRTTATR